MMFLLYVVNAESSPAEQSRDTDATDENGTLVEAFLYLHHSSRRMLLRGNLLPRKLGDVNENVHLRRG